MLKDLFKKKDNGEQPEQGPARKPERGRSMDPLLLNWLGGLIVALGAVATAGAYLGLIRDPVLHQSNLRAYTEGAARQQAAALGDVMADLHGRLRSTAGMAALTDALSADNEAMTTAAVAAISPAFPNAIDIRLINLGPRGTTVLKEGAGLRNFIEADLLSRLSTDGDAKPESYLHEDTWLTSLAATVELEDSSVRGALMVTLDNAVLQAMLTRAAGERGRITVTQPYQLGNNYQDRDIITTTGRGLPELASSALVPETSWTLTFAPAPDIATQLRPGWIPLAASFGMIAVALAVVMFVIQQRNRQRLAYDIDKLCYGSLRKGEKWTPLPILAPVAKRMRKIRKDGESIPDIDVERELDGEAEGSQEAPPLVDEKEFFTDPLFQNRQLLDEEGSGDTQAQQRTPASASSAQVPGSIFRANDIRGHAEEQLGDELVYRVGRSVAALCHESGDKHIIVGADGRHSSPRIRTALINGLLESGCDVIDLGTVTTPMLAFATNTLGPPHGIMITGSHCPGQINGLKIIVSGNVLSGPGLQALRNKCLQDEFPDGEGALSSIDILPTYRDRIVSGINIGLPLTVVVDGSNAVGGIVAPSILEALGCAVIPLNCVIDPDFPNHDPDPGVDNNLEQLYNEVLEHGADLGIALDGDADRIVAISAKGELVRPDRLLMLLAKDVLAANPGSAVVFDIKSSSQLAAVISDAGGVPTLSRTGHGFMQERMLESSAPIGAEFSGHVFFRDRWFGFDDGIYAAARLIELLSNAEQDLDEMLATLPQSFSTPEILVPVADSANETIIARLLEEARFEGATLNTLDGLRADFDDGWGLIRASNTSAALTLRFEADSEVALIRIRKQFKDQIAQVVPEIADTL